jgi:hypothetical protein
MHVLLTLLLQAQSAPAAPPPLPVSLERIRRGLEEPRATVTVLSVEAGLPPVFRMEIEQPSLDVERLWREDSLTPTFVRPSRGLEHHEFLGAVTPDLFRGTAQHPCCDVLPAIEALVSSVKKGLRKRAETRARREVQKALEEFKQRSSR